MERESQWHLIVITITDMINTVSVPAAAGLWNLVS